MKCAEYDYTSAGIRNGGLVIRYGQVETVIRGGGQLVSFLAAEPDLTAAFAKRFPFVRRTRNEQEILEDTTLQLIVSAATPNERAPLGIRVMRHGKDFMVDKPAATSPEQLAELRRVQTETRKRRGMSTAGPFPCLLVSGLWTMC